PPGPRGAGRVPTPGGSRGPRRGPSPPGGLSPALPSDSPASPFSSRGRRPYVAGDDNTCPALLPGDCPNETPRAIATGRRRRSSHSPGVSSVEQIGDPRRELGAVAEEAGREREGTAEGDVLEIEQKPVGEA